jgi:hypothetical protein
MKAKKTLYIALVVMVLLLASAFSMDIKIGDRVALFSNQAIQEGDVVKGDAIAVFGKLKVWGSINGDVVTVFGNAEIYGKVSGDVVAVFGNIKVHEGATIGGDTAGVFGSVKKEDGAVIGGQWADTGMKGKHRYFDPVPGMSFGSIMGAMLLYGAGCLMALLFPSRLERMVHGCGSNIGRKLGMGFLVLLAFILMIPILIITIIGILPAILAVILFFAVVLISSTAVYIALGQRIAAGVEGKNAVYIHLLIGLVIIEALKIIPAIGWLASTAVFLTGLGIAFDSRLGRPLGSKKFM